MHSDLAVEGMYFVRDAGGDAARYNDLLFDEAWRRGGNLEDVGLLARCTGLAGADPDGCRAALEARVYREARRAANRRAWGELGLRAVPSFRLEDGRMLYARLGVGVSRRELEAFLASVPA